MRCDRFARESLIEAVKYIYIFSEGDELPVEVVEESGVSDKE